MARRSDRDWDVSYDGITLEVTLGGKLAIVGILIRARKPLDCGLLGL